MTMGVYAITNTITGEQYIGSSIDIEKRWRVHCLGYTNRQMRDVQKRHGVDVFVLEVIEVVEDRAALEARERYHVEVRKPAYNSREVHRWDSKYCA